MTELVVRESGVVASLDEMEVALARADTDFERIEVRDAARRAEVAAQIVGRRDLQVKFGNLVAKAERALAVANPPAQGERTDIVIRNHDVPQDTLRQIRRAYGSMTDEEFGARIEQAEEQGEPLTRAAAIRERRKARQVEADERHAAREARMPSEVEPRLYVSSCAALVGHVEAESVDVIITDPPYPGEFLSCWDELAAFAVHALKPGGSLVTMSGQTFYLTLCVGCTLRGLTTGGWAGLTCRT